MVAGQSRSSCMPLMTSGTPDDSCARMITSRFLSETETRGISRKREPLEMSPSRVHPAEVRKGPGGIFLDERQKSSATFRSSSSLCRGHVHVDRIFRSKKGLSGPRCSRPRFAQKPCSQLPACPMFPHPHQTTLISGSSFLAPSAIYPFCRDHQLFLRSRFGSPNVGMSYATSI